jgi:hypothetical protein
MFNVFGYLRSQAKAAVLGGISDALAEVATDEQPADLDGLRKMLAERAKALPPATRANQRRRRSGRGDGW